MNKLNLISRILIAFAAIAFTAVFFQPAWRIDLFAPQYPEGLVMNIWINGLTGDVDVINGLNHYIGMKHISPGMFPEFSFLPYVIACFILLGIAVAVTGSRKLLLGYVTLIVTGAVLAGFDFYNWAYDYGHNLDPKAPIQVPGLSYQPPLLGHKRLLNFDAYSMPHIGGWIVISAAVLLLGIFLTDWFRRRRNMHADAAAAPALLLLTCLCLSVTGCSTGPEAFVAGRDMCTFCKMAISDLRYGGEVITQKGKVYKFDDLHCLAAFLRSGDIKEKDIKQVLVVDLEKPNVFLPADQAVYLQGMGFKSPMGSNTAAFASGKSAASFLKEGSTEVLDWETVFSKLKQ